MSIENPWAGQGHVSRYTHYNNAGTGKKPAGRYSINRASLATNAHLFALQNAAQQQLNRNEKRESLKQRLSIPRHVSPQFPLPNTSYTPEQIQSLVGWKIQELLNSKAEKAEKSKPLAAHLAKPVVAQQATQQKTALERKILIQCVNYPPACSHLLEKLNEEIKTFASTIDLTKGPQYVQVKIHPHGTFLYQICLDTDLLDISPACTIQ